MNSFFASKSHVPSHTKNIHAEIKQEKDIFLSNQCYYGENTGTIHQFLRQLAQYNQVLLLHFYRTGFPEGMQSYVNIQRQFFESFVGQTFKENLI